MQMQQVMESHLVHNRMDHTQIVPEKFLFIPSFKSFSNKNATVHCVGFFQCSATGLQSFLLI